MWTSTQLCSGGAGMCSRVSGLMPSYEGKRGLLGWVGLEVGFCLGARRAGAGGEGVVGMRCRMELEKGGRELKGLRELGKGLGGRRKLPSCAAVLWARSV